MWHRVTTVALAIALTLMAASQASADGGSTGGARAGAPPTPEMQKLAAAKLALAKLSLADGRRLGNPDAVTVAADETGPDYASIDMPVWMEPQYDYAFNWCGPGATSGVVSRWTAARGSDRVANWPGGKDAYMNYLAKDLNEVWYWNDANYQNDYTDFAQMVRVTNQEAGAGSFYQPATVGTFENYKSMLWYDIHDYHVPVIPVVETTGLPGWGAWSVRHWVTVKQFWFGGDTTTYGDSAGPKQRNSETYGWHVVPLTTFYERHIRTAYDQVVW